MPPQPEHQGPVDGMRNLLLGWPPDAPLKSERRVVFDNKIRGFRGIFSLVPARSGMKMQMAPSV